MAFVLYKEDASEYASFGMRDQPRQEVNLAEKSSLELQELLKNNFHGQWSDIPLQCPVLVEKPTGFELASSWPLYCASDRTDVSVGMVLSLSLIEGTMKTKMDAVAGLKKLKRIMGGEGQRESAYDWQESVDKAAEEELSRVFASNPEAVFGQLNHRDQCVQRASLAAIGRVATKGDERAIRECYSCLAIHPRSAFNALRRIAQKADERVIDACGKILDSYTTCSNWRHDLGKYGDFARALVEIADKNDERLIRTVSDRLESHQQDVRDAAVVALCLIADKDNEVAFSQIHARLEHSRLGTREAALQALVRIVHRGHNDAVAAVRARLGDRSKQVRAAATKALAELESNSSRKRARNI